MPFISGAMTYTKFSVLEQKHGSSGTKTEKMSPGKLNALLEPYKAAPLQELNKSINLRNGLDVCEWAPVQNLNPGVHWDLTDCEAGGGYYLKLRHSRIRVPSSLLNMLYKERLNDEEQEKSLSGKEKKELKEHIAKELFKNALPNIAYVEGLWLPEQKTLYVASTSRAKIDLFHQLFMDTFGDYFELKLVEENLLYRYLRTKNSRAESDVSAEDLTKELESIAFTSPLAIDQALENTTL